VVPELRMERVVLRGGTAVSRVRRRGPVVVGFALGAVLAGYALGGLAYIALVGTHIYDWSNDGNKAAKH